VAQAETPTIEITDAMIEAATAAIMPEFGYLFSESVYLEDGVKVAARMALEAGLRASAPRE
jgi:hypothetical protein